MILKFLALLFLEVGVIFLCDLFSIAEFREEIQHGLIILLMLLLNLLIGRSNEGFHLLVYILLL